MKVGILGSGDVGRSLGKGFASRGHDVKIGSRNAKSKELQAWLKETKGKGSTGSPAEAASHGEVIDGSRWLEGMVPLWVRVCTALGDWSVAWKVLHG